MHENNKGIHLIQQAASRCVRLGKATTFSSGTGARGKRTAGVIGTPCERSTALSAAKKLPVATSESINAID